MDSLGAKFEVSTTLSIDLESKNHVYLSLKLLHLKWQVNFHRRAPRSVFAAAALFMFSALQLVFLAVTIINIMGTERQAKVKITEEYKFHQKYYLVNVSLKRSRIILTKFEKKLHCIKTFQIIFVKIKDYKGEVLLQDVVDVLRALDENIDRNIEVR